MKTKRFYSSQLTNWIDELSPFKNLCVDDVVAISKKANLNDKDARDFIDESKIDTRFDNVLFYYEEEAQRLNEEKEN